MSSQQMLGWKSNSINSFQGPGRNKNGVMKIISDIDMCKDFQWEM